MATSTLTASTYTKPIKKNHAGTNSVVCTYSRGTDSGTVGDTIKLFKLPDRARIIGGYYTMIDADAQLTVQIRDYSDSGSSTTSAGFKLCSGSATQVTMIGIDGAAAIQVPDQISLSDAVINRYVDVEAIVASATLSLAFTIRLDYIVDDAT